MDSPSPRLILAAYTHFGAQGLKGTGMYHIVKEAWRRGWVEKVIAVSKNRCRYDFDLDLVETLPGESRLIYGLHHIKGHVWQAFPSRWLSEMIFDRYAASRLTASGDILIATPGLVRTARKAKALGYTTFLYGGHSDPGYLLQQIQLERKTFGLESRKQNRSRSWEMARFASHIDVSDYIIAISEFAAKTYAEYGFPSERIFIAPLGVDLNRFSATSPPADSDFTYLFMAHASGSTGILKGLPYLLQAWAEMSLQDARLIICGNIGREVQQLIATYKKTLRNVEFTGNVSNPAEYYKRASVFVFPSLAEGFGKVVLEAMASGRPVITTCIPKPVVRDGIDGFYISARDVQDLKDKMLYFYQHRDEVTRMGRNASQQARRFSWDRFSIQVAEIVGEVSARAYCRTRAPLPAQSQIPCTPSSEHQMPPVKQAGH
jgi:glycosyltransferase involved in cell wall biosynthesis